VLGEVVDVGVDELGWDPELLGEVPCELYGVLGEVDACGLSSIPGL